jgi:hypothetical protein
MEKRRGGDQEKGRRGEEGKWRRGEWETRSGATQFR